LAARAEHAKGWITAETLRRVEDDCIRRAAEMQAELGLKGVTDGEFRRGSWHMDFLY
jgi:5-methyltetrahydropteroyltriglutamate--homocysteine methyltransferase